jgi:hypothetical protein
MPAFLHTVHFWLKDDLTDEEKHDVLEGIRALAESPNVSRLSVRVPAGTPREVVDNSYDFQLVAEFDSQELHDAYQSPDDAAHQAFIQNYKDKWTKVLIYDSVRA